MKYCMDKYLNECIGNCKDDGVKALLLLQKDIEKKQRTSPSPAGLVASNNQKAKQAQFLAGGRGKPYRRRHF